MLFDHHRSGGYIKTKNKLLTCRLRKYTVQLCGEKLTMLINICIMTILSNRISIMRCGNYIEFKVTTLNYKQVSVSLC